MAGRAAPSNDIFGEVVFFFVAWIIMRPFGGHKSHTVGCRTATVKPGCSGLFWVFFLSFFKANPSTSLEGPLLFHRRVFRRHFHVPDAPVSDLMAVNAAPDGRKGGTFGDAVS